MPRATSTSKASDGAASSSAAGDEEKTINDENRKTSKEEHPPPSPTGPAPWCITVVGAPGCTLHRVHRMCEAPASRCFDVRLRQGAWCCTNCDPGAPHERDGDRMTIPKPRLLHHEQQAAQARSERQRREREASASHVHRTSEIGEAELLHHEQQVLSR